VTDTAIILAGGLGTRLRSVVSDVPKPMAPINGKPFLYYLLNFLEKNKIRQVVLSVGYKKEIITKYFGSKFGSINILYSNEDYPLGTGGAIRKAFDILNNKRAFILNGDTFFNISLKSLEDTHNKKGSSLTMAVTKILNPDRYDFVHFSSDSKILAFNNTTSSNKYINGGICIIELDMFAKYTFPEIFSFEIDFLFKHYKTENFFVYKSNAYFIDIGIPDSYNQFIAGTKNK